MTQRKVVFVGYLVGAILREIAFLMLCVVVGVIMWSRCHG